MIPVSAAEGYALWAETWDSTPSPIVALERRGLTPWLAGLHPTRAVDIGCGTGRWTRELGALGFDFSAEMLAKATDLRGRLAQADAAALPIASNCCDLVVCALMLAHLPHPEPAWQEFARILQPGGTLFLSDFHPQTAARGWRRTFRRDAVVYELEHHPYSFEQLQSSVPELRLTQCADLSIDEPERHLFAAAGRPELFDAAGQTPVVLLSRWTRV
jgi:SAM-dependent methyltransferase